MKSAIYKQYGSPEVLTIKEIDKPEIKEKEILVKVKTTTINRTDCAILRAKPFVMRFTTGLFKPVRETPGTDFAGIIEQTGSKVTAFKKDEKVFGFNDIGLKSQAEYLKIEESSPIEKIPENITFSQAAASIEGAHYALNFLNKIEIPRGAKILINGATGAIGNTLFQLVKNQGFYTVVTGNSQNIDLLSSQGADRIINYEKADFTKDDERFDFVLDAVGKSSFGACKNILTKKGIYISSELGAYGQNIFYSLISPLSSGRKVKFPFPSNIKRSLKTISNLLKNEKFNPVIEKEYSFKEISEAYSYVEKGLKTGNIILNLDL